MFGNVSEHYLSEQWRRSPLAVWCNHWHTRCHQSDGWLGFGNQLALRIDSGLRHEDALVTYLCSEVPAKHKTSHIRRKQAMHYFLDKREQKSPARQKLHSEPGVQILQPISMSLWCLGFSYSHTEHLNTVQVNSLTQTETDPSLPYMQTRVKFIQVCIVHHTL